METIATILIVLLLVDIFITIYDRLTLDRTKFNDILLKIDELKIDFEKFHSHIENYSQQTCISGEEFDEKLEEVRKILVELEKRGNENGQ